MNQTNIVKKVLLILGFAMPSMAMAGQVPYCWTANQPDAKIQDGVFVLELPTADQSAADVADVLFNFQGAELEQRAVGALSDLKTIEIDFAADVSDYRPSVAYPTLDSLKDAIISDTEYRLSQIRAKGVAIRCAKELRLVRPLPLR